MNTRTLFYAFLALHLIHAAANDEPAGAQPTSDDSEDMLDELVQSIRSVRPAEIYTVLGRICESGHYGLVEMLLGQLALNWGIHGTGPIVAWAVQHGHPGAVKAVVNGMGSTKQHELERACRSGCVELVEALLADPTVDPAASENAALIAACIGGHVPIVERLCSTGRVSPIANRYEPVHIAIEHDHFNLLRYMMDESANGPHKFIKQGSRMPVSHATKMGRLESLVVLMGRDQESHARLEDHMLKGLKIDITKLSPNAVRACVIGDLEELKANTPMLFNSLDELDVLLGLARHHPTLVAYLKKRQQDYIVEKLPGFNHIMEIVKDELTLVNLLRSLEAREVYNFLTGKQLMGLAEFLARIKRSSHRLNAEELIWMLGGGPLPNGFKRID
jgi:hypothetical protein